MKVHLFYISQENIDKMITKAYQPYDAMKSNGIILYAFTRDSELAKQFIKTRSKLFIHKKSNISKEEYSALIKEFKSYELSSMNMSKELCNIPISLYEETACDDDGKNLVDMTAMERSTYPYDILKTEYQKVLDYILYTYYHVLQVGDDSEIEMVDNNLNGYCCSPLGCKYPIGLKYDKLGIFISLFKNTFKDMEGSERCATDL